MTWADDESRPIARHLTRIAGPRCAVFQPVPEGAMVTGVKRLPAGRARSERAG